jgi:hypothetical protein
MVGPGEVDVDARRLCDADMLSEFLAVVEGGRAAEAWREERQAALETGGHVLGFEAVDFADEGETAFTFHQRHEAAAALFAHCERSTNCIL